MFRSSANKISFAASALLLGAGFVQAQTEPVSPVSALPATVGVSFQLPSTINAAVSVVLSVTQGSYTAVINPSTVPSWLSITGPGLTGTSGSGPSGTVDSTPLTVSFQANANAAALGAGTYTQPVHIAVSGYQDLIIPVTLSVEPPPSLLSVTNAGTVVAADTVGSPSASGTVALSWVYGSTPMPSASLIVLSNDAPVAFTAVATPTSPTSPATWTQLNSSSGIAYNFGTPLTVTFLPDVLNNAAVGTQLTSTVTISYTAGATAETLTIDVTITVTQPYATLSAANPIFPAYTPVQSSGTLKVVVTGTGFYAAGGSTSATVVKISYTGSGGLVALQGLGGTGSVALVNSTTMILTIPFEDAVPNDILNTVQAITISLTSSVTINAVLETPVTATLHVTQSPIIYSVVDAGALEEPAAGVTPSFSPYELVSIFGANFCPAGCANPVVAAVGAESRYPQSLTAGGQPLSVNFNNQSGTLIAQGFLIFATNNQINVLVPSTIIATGITGLQIVVSSSATPNLSNVYLANPAAANPGIFTVDASGQGQGAILNPDSSVNSITLPATTGTTVSIYVSGLGAPNSTSILSTSTKAPVFPTSCFETSLYVSGENLTNPPTADGAVLVPTIWGVGNLPPCFATKSYLTVSINAQPATVTYAGWVADSVTGLYQINVTIPTKATTSSTAVSVPVTVTVGTGTSAVSSQTGVTMAIKD
jgi:uncharacterized protein (TIGR03437 family)